MIGISYSAAERETVLQTDDESGKWILHTYQGKVQTKLRKANIQPVEEYPDGGARYELDFNQVSFRSKSKGRNMTEEQRKAASERLKKIRSKK
jgi:hypothetical protein